MKRLIPRNPNSKSPDRRSTVIHRVLIGLGGAALCGSSIALIKQMDTYSMDRSLLITPGALGIILTGLVIAEEIIERLGNGKDGEEGGGGWDWRNPDDPDSPNDPNCGGIKLIEEIEDYLRTQEPVLV